MIGNLHSSSRPARWAHKPKNPIISRSGHGEHLIAGGRPGLAESHKLCLVGFDSQATQPFSAVAVLPDSSGVAGVFPTCRYHADELNCEAQESTKRSARATRYSGILAAAGNFLSGRTGFKSRRSSSALRGVTVAPVKSPRVTGEKQINFSRMQPRTTLSRPGNTCRLLSESGGIRHGGSRPLNRQGLRNVEFDGPGVRSGANPDSPTILACGTTLPARGYSFSTAAFRFPRHPFWQSEMRSHPFPKVRVGAAYKEEGTRFARPSFTA